MKSYNPNCEKGRPVIIWGIALYGEVAYKVLHDVYGRDVEAFVDNKSAVIPWLNRKTIRSSGLLRFHDCDVLCCAAGGLRVMEEEAKKYESNGLRFFNIRDILKIYIEKVASGELTASSSYLYGTLDLDEMQEKYEYYCGSNNDYGKKIYLGYCVLCITTKCSLRCKECASFVNYYHPQSDYSLMNIKEYFGRFLSVIDGIQELELMGGEPFLCGEFNEILQWCIDQSKIHAIKIITNGTILPSQKTLRLLSDNKVKLVIDDYGALSRKLPTIVEEAAKFKIRYEIQSLQTWYSLIPQKSDERKNSKQIKAIYENCMFRSCIGVTNGRLYHCNVAGHMHNVGLLVDTEMQYVDLKDKTVTNEELRQAIQEYLEIPYLYACGYCSYSSHIEVPVAEQEG